MGTQKNRLTCVLGAQKLSFEHPKTCLNWWVRKYIHVYAKKKLPYLDLCNKQYNFNTLSYMVLLLQTLLSFEYLYLVQ